MKQAKPRPDLLNENSPEGLEVFQITVEADVPACHIYMEAQVFTPDSRRFLLHRSSHAHGPRKDPEHQYLLCDLDDGFSLQPVITERNAIAPSVTPDGKYIYYFIDETETDRKRFLLRRVNMDGKDPQTVLAVDGCLPRTELRPRTLYPLSTISSDGERLAISSLLTDADGEADKGGGLMVFDLQKADVNLIVQGRTWLNLHPQYCRATDPDSAHDLMIQQDHSRVPDENGEWDILLTDVHLIRDDGTDFRTLPWGRDGNESCQGHQCWRGKTRWAITSTDTRNPKELQLIEGMALAHDGHGGRTYEDAESVRNDLTRTFPHPRCWHFATDGAGRRLITDCEPRGPEGGLFVADLGEPGKDPLTNIRHLVLPRSSWKKEAHVHPFLSPDGTYGFFNSDESGMLQAYAVKGF